MAPFAAQASFRIITYRTGGNPVAGSNLPP